MHYSTSQDYAILIYCRMSTPQAEVRKRLKSHSSSSLLLQGSRSSARGSAGDAGPIAEDDGGTAPEEAAGP